MSSSDRLPASTRLARWALRPLFRGIFRLISNVTVSGSEHVPQKGAYLIAPNHVSLYDPALVMAFWPCAAEAVAASDVWDRPGQSLLVGWYDVIPVHRHEYDRHALEPLWDAWMRQTGDDYARGRVLHVPACGNAEPGIAYILEKINVPVVPVGVVGTTDDFFRRAMRGERPSVYMYIGEPMLPPPIESKGEARRLARQRNADLIMMNIATLLPPEYRGVYADPAILDA
jgi:1-acyl-sn-glycerol-3-phosphate acyltransferase